jgi:ketosteroid isomerase-like protein
VGFTGSLEDRIAIRELHEAYADTAFRSDMEGWLDCWAEDSVWITPFGEVRGREQFVEQWGKIGDSFGVIGFFPVLGAIEVTGDRATSRGYVREIAAKHDGGLYKVVGRYDDELHRTAGGWRFTRRAYSALIRENGVALP